MINLSFEEVDEPNGRTEREGSWFCLHCKRPVKIAKVEKTSETYTLVSDCPEKHSITLKIQDNGISYLTFEEQIELAKVFLATTLDELEKSNKDDMLTVNAVKAMAKISGLKEEECETIIKTSMNANWVKETQPLILDRIAKGDKDYLKKEVTIEDVETKKKNK